jgi:hypothetical protein
MSTIVGIPMFWRGVVKPLRIVYKARSVPQAARLQSQLPTSIVALPQHATYVDVERYAAHLRMPTLCATASLMYPLRSLDILQNTPCTMMLMRNVLVFMDEEKRTILGHEEVMVCG